MIKYNMMRKGFAALAFFFVSFALVNAVSVSDFYNWSVEFTPDTPGPNASVSANVVSYSFDVNRANITWLLNSQKKLQGTGQKTFSFFTGNLGSQTNVSVLITTEDGIQLQKNFSFKPADVDILWETENYTPVSYKGKALASSGSLVKITAIPYFTESASKLIYEWQIDYKNKPDISGTGKNSFTFRSADIYNVNKVGLTVSNYSKSAVAKKSIDIEIGAPKIIFYEQSPLEGPKYNRALASDIQLDKDEIIVRAEPYFFSAKDLEDFIYEWKMNGEKIAEEAFPNVLSLKKGEGSGRSLIDVKISNPLNILQYGDNSLEINY